MFDKLNEIDQLYAEHILSKCKGCKGIDYCAQEMKGLIPVVIRDELTKTYSLGKKKCDKVRGNFNDSLIKEHKYTEWTAKNKDEIIKHIKEHNGIYVHGKVGRGKSHFLYWLANKVNLKGKDIYIDTISNINRKVKQEFNVKSDYDTPSFLTKLQDIDYLFIDDIGNESKSEYNIMEILFPLIDFRYVNKKPTFISSNYKIDELYKMYSSTINGKNQLEEKVSSQQIAPIMSRLKTFGEIELIGRNWRL